MDPIALRYSSCAWNLEFCQNQASPFDTVRKYVEALVKDAEDEDSLSLEQLATIAEWKNLLVLQQAKWAELLEGARDDAEFAQGNYERYLIGKGFLVFKPHFFLDTFCAISRLRIQKWYNVGREAFHIDSSTFTATEFNGWRKAHNIRTYYTGSSLITPDLLPAAEIADLRAEGDGTYGIRSFFPREIAEIAGVRRDGFPLDKERREEIYEKPFEEVLAMRDVEEASELGRDAVHRRAWDRRLWLENDDCVLDTTPEDDMRQAEELIQAFNCVFEAEINLQGYSGMGDGRANLWVEQQHQRSSLVNANASNQINQAPLQAQQPVPNTNPVQNLPSQQPATPAIPAAPAQTVSRHGRPIPYTSTPQQITINRVRTKHTMERGRAPAGMDDKTWRTKFDNADSRVYRRATGTKEARGQARRQSKVAGETRDMAIDNLIARGLLAAGFRDLHP
ncbi:hypothetical protein DL95DRAFT_409913 [Leptodontidium sp. 2 PMI_412]|nr:hypothetical protein DL95DRAFT_409913 [Leptodontidium sp. 2 PMI_412]